jgi:hypothetical protein
MSKQSSNQQSNIQQIHETMKENKVENKVTSTRTDPTATTSLTPMTPANDSGFFDSDESEGFAPSLIIGIKVKFTNAATWLAGEEAIPEDRKFAVAKIVRAVQKWTPGCRRPESRILEPDEPFPDVKKMKPRRPRRNGGKPSAS